jgi:hypothetical protein
VTFHDTYIDAPAHPLGLAFHPEWQAVRDRKAERECNKIMRDAAEAQRAARQAPVIIDSVVVRALQLLVCVGFVACFWWALS